MLEALAPFFLDALFGDKNEWHIVESRERRTGADEGEVAKEGQPALKCATSSMAAGSIEVGRIVCVQALDQGKGKRSEEFSLPAGTCWLAENSQVG